MTAGNVSILRNSLFYAGIGVLGKLLPLALLPIYARYLTAADFGVVATVLGVAKLLVLFYALGGGASMLRHSFREKDGAQGPEQVWGTLVVFLLLVGGAATLVLTIGADWILTSLAKDVPFWPLLALGLAIAFFNPIRGYFLTSLQARELGWGYAVHAGGAMLLRVPVVVFCLHFMCWKAEAVLFSILVSEMFFAVLGLIGFNKVVCWGLDPSILRSSLAYSLPLLPHALAGWVATYLGVMVLNFSVGPAEAGFYNLANQFNIGIALLGMAYVRALTPTVFRALSTGEPTALADSGRRVIMGVAGMGIVCLFMSLFAGEITLFVLGDRFAVVGNYVPVFAASAFLYVLHSFHVTILLHNTRGTWWLLASSISAMAVTMVLMFWLIPLLGVYGGAYAAASGVVLRLLLLAWLCNTRFRVFWCQSRFWGIGALVIAGSLAPMLWTAGAGNPASGELAARSLIFLATAAVCVLFYRRTSSQLTHAKPIEG